MSSVKEPHVFGRAQRIATYPNYDGMFEEGPPRRGESSTGYARYPVMGDPAPEIYAAVPDAKLIYLVGDPVERIVSDYVQARATGGEDRTLDEAVSDYESLDSFYVCASRYATQAERYLANFDRSQLLVLEQWALRNDREGTLRRIFEFLDVDPGFWSKNFQPEIGTRQEHVKYNGVRWRLRHSAAGALWRKLPVHVRLPMSRVLRFGGRSVPRPELSESRRAELLEFLRPEMARLRELTGEPLPHLP
jgi:hypothetical protein